MIDFPIGKQHFRGSSLIRALWESPLGEKKEDPKCSYKIVESHMEDAAENARHAPKMCFLLHRSKLKVWAKSLQYFLSFAENFAHFLENGFIKICCDAESS